MAGGAPRAALRAGMSKLLTFSLGLLVFAGADIPGSERLRPSTMPNGTFSPTDEIGVLPDDPAEGQQAPQADTKKGEKAATLQETSKLEVIRYVSGQFAKATRDLPAGQAVDLHHVDKPLSAELLERAVATHGAAVHVGDSALITQLAFRDPVVVVARDGGGGRRRHLRGD